ncbi:formylglycine-generating enzyme family protein [Myxococcota bacterium]|nr:formylglycine-generating enzyme family protein [Myxococcota bacterium]
MALVDIPGAKFQLGLDREQLAALEPDAPEFPFDRELPAHRVSVAPFRISATLVTNAEYFVFVDRGGYRNAALWRPDDELLDSYGGRDGLVDATGRPGPLGWRDGAPLSGTEAHPVTGVSWFEARAYARSVERRLPTEAEWELAARGATRRLWAWGDAFEPSICPLDGALRAVGAEPRHVSPFGIFDLGGLVAEWCSDPFRRYGERDGEPALDRVVRSDHAGGTPISVRVTVRTGHSPARRAPGFGFRVAESPQPSRLMPKLR